jgi:phosphinothricin acetyltransferase
MELGDWPAVRAIYLEGIRTGHATFESEPPDWARFDATRLAGHRHVAIHDGEVVGWIAASPVSSREVYAGVVEHSVYVTARVGGHGVGRRMLDALIDSTEAAGIWTIQSSIFPQNSASLHLHERAGFRVVGTRERVARMTYGPLENRWRDTVFVERRSAIAGL